MAFKLEAIKGATYPLTELNKTTDDIQKMNLDTLYSYYQKHFLSSDELLCVVTGSFEIDKLKKELVGTLSHLKRQEGASVKKTIQKPFFPDTKSNTKQTHKF